MDPLHQNEDNTRLLEDQFEMLLKEVDNFHKTMVPAAEQSTEDATDFENFNDHLVSSNNKNNSCLPEYVLHEYNRLLHDFQELETTMIPPHQKNSMYVQNSNDYYLPGTSQNPKPTTLKNEFENGSTWAINYSSNPANTTHLMDGCVSTGGRSIGVTMSAATYDNGSGSGIGCRGGMFPTVSSCGLTSSMGLSMIGNSFIGNGLTSGITRMASWRQLGGNEKPRRRPKRKRRYRGVYQTEAEAILKQELLKIKQRATSAEAYQKKKAYISHLEEQVDKLHEQNKCLKYSLMFLGSNPVPTQKPLKKTISGPI